jgi:glycosyltransferase involved in cell wall biosynthesis
MTNCDPALPNLKFLRERKLYMYGLRRADVIISQTFDQRKGFETHFGLDSVVIHNCGADPYPPGTFLPAGAPVSRNQVLWIGRPSAAKRLEWLFAVARRCPEQTFHIVGPALEYVRAVRAQSGHADPEPVNVITHGPLLRSELEGWYRRSGLLLSTSLVEGYPNTFIEAWSHGVPLVSTLDPDDVIRNTGLGAVATTPEQLAEEVRRICGSPEDHADCSRRARAFFLEHHAVAGVIRSYTALLQRLTSPASVVL